MKVDYLIKYLSGLPADSEVFCWLATIEDFDDTYPNLPVDSWNKSVASAEKWCDPYSEDLNSLIRSCIKEITNE